MPPKKVHSVSVNFATKTITINDIETTSAAHVVVFESVSEIHMKAQETKTLAPMTYIIHEFRAFETELQRYASYGVTADVLYQTLLHADTIRKITLMRAFPGLVNEPAIVEHVVRLLFSNRLVCAYRGGYRKTAKCLERLQRIVDTSVAPVGSYDAQMERAKKKEKAWYGNEEFDGILTTLFTQVEMSNKELAVELRKLRVEAIKKGAPVEHIARLDEEIKTYQETESEVELVKRQAKDIATGAKRQKGKLPRKHSNEVYSDE